MKIVGLILELNPFHNGHNYFISKVRQVLTPDLLIALISTNYTMRGEVSIISKHQKAKLLIQHGVDIVVGLPFISTNQSADIFSKNMVETLKMLKINYLAFGAEDNNIDTLLNLKNIINTNEFSILLKQELKKGNSFEISAKKVIEQITNSTKLTTIFTKPNNKLAIQYLNNIDESITPYIVKRVDNNYYDLETNTNIASATTIRTYVNNSIDIKKYIPYELNLLKESEINFRIFELLKYTLIINKSKLSNIAKVKEGIENRFLDKINLSNSYSSFVENVSTRRYKDTTIKRIILNIIGDITNDDIINPPPFYTLLAFSSKGSSFLKNYKNLPLLTTLKNNQNKHVLTELKMLKLYDYLTNQNTFNNEFKKPYQGEKE